MGQRQFANLALDRRISVKKRRLQRRRRSGFQPRFAQACLVGRGKMPLLRIGSKSPMDGSIGSLADGQCIVKRVARMTAFGRVRTIGNYRLHTFIKTS